MAVIRKTLTFRPKIWEMISNEAKLRDVNVSRCIEDRFEFESKVYNKSCCFEHSSEDK